VNYGRAARTDERIKAFAGQFGAGCPRTTIYEPAAQREGRLRAAESANARTRGLIRTAGIAKSMFTLSAARASARDAERPARRASSFRNDSAKRIRETSPDVSQIANRDRREVVWVVLLLDAALDAP